MPYIGSSYGSGSGSSSSNSSTTYISSGTTIAPTITYNTGFGTVTIGDGTYRLFHTTNYTGAITEHNISGATFLITEHITTYICSDYNNGVPIIRVITDSNQFNWSNIIPIYTVSRDGDNFSYIDWDAPGNGLPNKIHTRLVQTDRFSRVSGLDIGESAMPVVRTIIVSPGIIWQGVYKNSMDSVDSSVDITKMLYTDGTGNWIDNSITIYNNTQYDTGLGLATLTDGNYAVNWIFRMIGNQKEIIVFLGDGDFDLNTAKASQLPNNIPASIFDVGMLIGRIIVLKGADIATQIDSAFTTKFAASTVTSHSGLTSIIGGDALTGNYYHSDQEINTDSDVEFASVTTNDYRSLDSNLNLNAYVGYDIIAHDNIIPSLNNSKTLGESGLVYAETFTRKVTSDDDLSLDALTGKNIVIKKSVLPDVTNTHDIGSATKVIKEVFTEKVTSDVDLILGSAIGSDIILRNGNVDAGIITDTGNWGIGNINPTKKLEITGDVLIDGDLSVDGTVTQVDVVNLDVTNKNINLAVTDTPTDALANGGGIVLKGTTDKTILWDNSNVEWDISDGLDVDGIIKANGTTNDSSTNIFIGKDSLAVDVFKVDTDGKVTASAIVPITDSTTAFKITKSDGTTTILNVDTTNERVGIGTTSPLAPLQVSGTPNTSTGLLHLRSPALSSSYITFTENGVLDKGAIGFDSNGGSILNFYTGGLLTSGSVKMSITSEGNVGINVTNPTHKLEIKGSALYGIQQVIGDGTNAESSIGFKDTSDTNASTWVIGKNLGEVNTTDRFGIFYNDGEKLVVTTEGKMGCGTNIPIGKVQINTDSLYSDSEYNQHGMIIASGDAFDSNIELYMGADNTNNVGYIQVTGDGNIKPLLLQARGGNIGIGTNLPTSKLHVVGGDIKIDADATFWLSSIAQISKVSGTDRLYVKNGVNGCYIARDGTGWTSASDIRLKDNIVPIDNVLDKVIAMNPVTFTYKDSPDKAEVGFIAQEIETLGLDEVVVKPKNDDDFYGLDYEKFVVYLVKGMQEQQEIINKQQQQIGILIQKVESLMSK